MEMEEIIDKNKLWIWKFRVDDVKYIAGRGDQHAKDRRRRHRCIRGGLTGVCAALALGRSARLWRLCDVATLGGCRRPVSYIHLRAHETGLDIVCRTVHENNNFSRVVYPQNPYYLFICFSYSHYPQNQLVGLTPS